MEETMTKRSPLGVFFFSLITVGIYSWYWLVKTKGELNGRGASVPTAWIWLIPFVGYLYWLVKYSEGVATATGGKKSTVAAFLWLFLLSVIGQAVLQSSYNELT
jgi:hypothetical protein